MKLSHILALVLIAVSGELSLAKDVPVQARLFAGSATVDPKELNTELGVQGLKKVENYYQYGVEVSYPILPIFDFGLRYSKHYVQRDELQSSLLTDYKAQIDQDSAMFIARIPVVKTAIVRLDAFAGFGGSNTTLTMKTATQDGQLTRKDETGWFASPYSVYGGSVAIGYKMFYLVVEAGMESNKPTGFTKKDNITSNIQSIDLSGSYVNVGLLFDGVALKK